MKSSYWLFLSGAVACVAASSACSSDFTSCSASRTCPSGGAAGRGEAGQAGEVETEASAGATAVAGSAGDDSTSQSIAGQGGEAPEGPGIAGAAGEASACDAGVDFNSDAKNCGSCGHDCLGGECDHGSCQPVTIVPADSYINDFALAGDYVYWSSCNQSYTDCFVARRRLDLSDEIKVFAHDQKGDLEDVAVSNNNLVWFAGGYMRVCTLPDCLAGPQDALAVPDSGQDLIHFAETAQVLFWSSYSANAQRRPRVKALLPSSAMPMVVWEAGDIVGLASDDKDVYWVSQSTRDSVSTSLLSDGSVWRARLSDLMPVQLASGLTGQGGRLAVGPDALFLAGRYDSKNGNGIANAIFRIPLPNGVGAGVLPRFADTSQNGNFVTVGGMVADATDLYWIDQPAGLVQRCALSNCKAPAVVASTGGNGFQLKQDSKSLFWVTQSNLNGIARVAK